MCVIAVNEEVRMTKEHVEKMWVANPAGGGVAWRDGDVVVWRKGLEEDEMIELCATVPLPFIAHFRVPSGGFGASKALTHPFPITKDVDLALEGRTKGAVLFHNGHWKDWKETSLKTAVAQSRSKLPTGRWSDTRAMAWAASHYGLGILEFIDEKVIVFTPSVIEVFQPLGWSKVDGLWVSNKGWEHRVTTSMQVTHNAYKHNGGGGQLNQQPNYHTTPPASMTPTPPSVGPAMSNEVKGVVAPGTGGSSAKETFREGTGSVPSGEAVTQQTQEGQTSLRQGETSRRELICLPDLSYGNQIVAWVRGLNPSKVH